MRIYVRGKATALSKEEIKFAAKFFAANLMSSKQRKKTNIKINLKEKNEFKGDCEVDDVLNPYNFSINILNKMSKRSQLHTLAHEMVHVKQYVKKELIDYSSLKLTDYSKWKNKKYNLNRIKYFDQPWEIDAYGRELGLYLGYKDHLKKSKKKFK